MAIVALFSLVALIVLHTEFWRVSSFLFIRCLVSSIMDRIKRMQDRTVKSVLLGSIQHAGSGIKAEAKELSCVTPGYDLLTFIGILITVVHETVTESYFGK